MAVGASLITFRYKVVSIVRMTINLSHDFYEADDEKPDWETYAEYGSIGFGIFLLLIGILKIANLV